MQSKKSVTSIVVIVLVIVLAILFFKGKDVVQSNENGVDTFRPDEIAAVHSYDNGTHTLAGEIDLPTPCHTLNVEALVRESFPEQVSIEFDTTSGDGDLCAQVITPTPWDISFQASEEPVITGAFNDEPIRMEIEEAE